MGKVNAVVSFSGPNWPRLLASLFIVRKPQSVGQSALEKENKKGLVTEKRIHFSFDKRKMKNVSCDQ